MFQQVQQEFLREILGFRFAVASRADKLVERGPITAAEVLQRLSSGRFTAQSSLRQEGPMCCRKVHVSADQIQTVLESSPLQIESSLPDGTNRNDNRIR